MYYKGTTSDTAITFVVGEPSMDQRRFMDVGIKTLRKTIEKAKAGNRIRDLAETIQKNIESAGYSVTRNLTGHGVGKSMHEEPPIPCFVSADPGLRTKIEVGMVLAIEIMYMKGNWPLKLASDGWTLSTKDGSDSAVFEEDVLITTTGPEILTDIRD
jgi:methionyl aminopeptidase